MKNAKVLRCQKDQNVFYISLRRHFISLKEGLHKSEYENELQHFQNTVKKNNDWKDVNTNQIAKKPMIVLGMAIPFYMDHIS